MLTNLSEIQVMFLRSLSLSFFSQSVKVIAHCLFFLSVLFLLFFSMTVHAVITPNFGFANGPTLLAGGNSHLTVGAKYIYQNVETSSDGVLVDAVVTIVDIQNSAIVSSTIDQPLGEDVRFEPLTNTSAIGGYVEWQVEFVQDGTVVNATDTGVRAYLNNFTLEAIDVDGYEYFEAIVTNSYTLENKGTKPTNLSVSANGVYTRFQSGADSANNIDIAKTEYIVRINYQNVSVLNFRNGSLIDSGDRQNSMSFQGEVTFNKPRTTIVNVPPTVLNSTGNTTNIDTAFNINLLTGANDADGNLELSSVVLIDPNDATNTGTVGKPLVVSGVGTYAVSATGNLSFVPVSGYTGSANILFTVSDALKVYSDQGLLELVVGSVAGPVVTLNSIPHVSIATNEAVYLIEGNCTSTAGDVTVTVTGATPDPATAPCVNGYYSVTVDTSSISDGIDAIVANASQVDSTGNVGNATPQFADKDTTAPIVSLNTTPDVNAAFNEASYPVSGTCTAGDGDVAIRIAGARPDSLFAVCLPDGTFSATVNTSGISDGINTIVVNASQIDSVGNIAHAAPVSANKDTVVTNPTCIFTPAMATTGESVSVSCSGVESGSTLVIGALACSAESAGEVNCTGNAENIGSNPAIIITDSAGNTNTVTGVFTFNGVAPVVTINSAPIANNSNVNNYPVSGTCTEGDSDVTVSIAGISPSQTVSCDAGSWGPVIFDVSSLPDGSEAIVINASQTDGSGHVGNAPVVKAEKMTSGGTGDDVDGDGIVDEFDIDNDNDGIPDSVEQLTAINSGDTDGDGIKDERDLDSDGDGINDINESGLTPAQIHSFDADNNGVIDATVSVGVNGLADAIETDDTQSAFLDQDGDGNADGPVDTDNDSRPDFQDLDADNDGIHDLIEVDGPHPDTSVDTNNDGVVDDNGTDADQDGIPDSIDTNATEKGGLGNNPVDTDGNGVANFRDLDSDNDGIIDLYESGIFPDTTLVDSNNDGMLDNPFNDADGDGVPASGDNDDGVYGDPQSVNVVDTDGDGIPDYLDLDSDNDSIPDVTEAGNQDDDLDGLLDPGGAVTFPPNNTDGTDNPDHLDPDSNNDGINDIDDAGNEDADGNGDGIADGMDDADEDGLLDPVDGEPNVFGNDGDSDADGIANSMDLDDDNDGIPDTAEKDASGNDVDTDGDGIVDRIDLDSDNDGLPDSIEAILAVFDEDANGILDNFIDSNNDGLDDNVSPEMIPLDTDNDGQPDFRDIDTDNDGLTDLYEANGFNNTGDNDGNGILDNLTDLDKDGLADIVDPVVGNGLAGTKLPNPDTDLDGIANFREVDSDGDGYSDKDENGDFDGNGVKDNLQKDGPQLETAVNGVGGSLSPIGLVAIMLLLVMRSLRGVAIKKQCTVILLALPILTTTSALASTDINTCGRNKPCFYGGVGYLFATHVDPERTAQTWKTSDDSDSGYNIYLGWHFQPRWFGEISYADLGEAGLKNAAAEEGGITYKIPSAHVGYWFFKPENRFNLYAKAGLSSISNKATKADIPFEKQNSVNVTGGIGVQWRSLTSGLFARLAADFYDRDAHALGINIGYYFGGAKSSRRAPDSMSHAKTMDADADGVTNEEDLCPQSAPGVSVDTSGCQLPDLSLRGVNFKINSAKLTGQSTAILDNAAAALLNSPRIKVEVQAHTDSIGDEYYNNDLSQRRAMTVMQYLEDKGVSADRMEAQGYGESAPIATNKTRWGRYQNRRVELVIIDK